MAYFLYTIVIYPLYMIIELIFSVVFRLTDKAGVSVIAVSAGISLLCLPLYAVAEHWQEVERKKQAQMKDGLDRIKKAFSGDERYMMTTAFYKENNYSPIMGLRSSFGLLIQIPFFIAAYGFLSKLETLKGVPFLFIHDMGRPDALFSVGSFQVNILPVAMTLINMISGAIYTKGHSLREKIQVYGMALIFLVILYNSPSGLVLYWTMNNVFSMVKNIFYKFKKPLRAFWILCLSVSVILLIIAVSSYHIAYEGLFVVLVLLVALIPLFVKAVSKLLDSRLHGFMENKGAKNGIFIGSCILLFILSGLEIPTSLIASSPAEFAGIGSHPNPMWYVYNTALQAAGLFIFWPICIYFLFNKRIKTVLAVLMTAAGLVFLADTYIFMLSYGDISSSLVFLDTADFKTFSAVSILNILAGIVILAVVIIFINAKKGKIFSYSITILTLALAAISIGNSTKIIGTYNEYKIHSDSAAGQTVSPIFHLSKDKPNVILLMLDKASNHYVTSIFEESKKVSDSLTGFTLYPNTVSFNRHTLQGAPGIWGGYEYTPYEMNRRSSETLKDKNNQAILLLPRIFTETQNYSAVITDPSWANHSQTNICDLTFLEDYPEINGYRTIGTYTDYWLKKYNQNGELLDNSETILSRNLLFFSFFREFPIFLREFLYKKGQYWSSNGEVVHSKIILDNYSVLDILPELTDFNNDKDGSYICIVNELSHDDQFMQAPDFIPVANVTDYGTSRFKDFSDYHTMAAAFTLLAKWFDYLKANGVYDNTRIILVSDHGSREQEDCFDEDSGFGKGRLHPLLMLKDFNSDGQLQQDMTFMTNADVPSLLLKDLVQSPVNPFTEKPIPVDTTELKQNGVIVSRDTKHKPEYHNPYTYDVDADDWLLVKDDIFQSQTWERAQVQAKDD